MSPYAPVGTDGLQVIGHKNGGPTIESSEFGPGAPPVDPAFLAGAAEICGPAHLFTDPEVVAGQSIDFTGRYRFPPAPVVRPGHSAEVAALVGLARRTGVGLVAQGGNTGLVGGALASPGRVIVDLRRFDTIDDIDPVSGQITAGAGVTIERLQDAARRVGWDYGVDWAARQSATVGGSIATDAGGLRFVRHGSTRHQVLGVEAVLGTGQTYSHLPRVEKDNTGYDLGALMCGSEGTLGLVTGARLRLVAPTGPVATALVGFATTGAAVTAAGVLRRTVPLLEAVELMTAPGQELVCATLGLSHPMGTPDPCVLLVEVAGSDPVETLGTVVGALAGVTRAVVADSGPRRRALWRLREAHTEAIATLGPVHKLDVSLPGADLAAFIDEAPALVATVAPQAATWCFGHAADGNVHVNVTGAAPDDERLDEVLLTRVAALGGSISAEHGIGRAKRRWLHLARGAEELAVMKAIKAALDPDGVCNPEILFPAEV